MENNGNYVKLVGTLVKGTFEYINDKLRVNVIIDRNGYQYRANIAEGAMKGLLKKVGQEVAIEGKLRIYGGETFIEVEDIELED